MGLHLVWDEVVVTQKDAMCILAVTLSNLQYLSPDILHWQSCLDGSVYKNNGLRMIYSVKGRVQKSFYEPWLEYSWSRKEADHDGEFVEILGPADHAHIVKWLHACSIICYNETLVHAYIHTSVPSSAKVATMRDVQDFDGKEQDVEASWQEAWMHISRGTAYEMINLQKCYMSDTDNIATFQINSRYCQNIQREHKSNHVYIVVSATLVEQRCHCRCSDKDCAKYRGKIAEEGNALSRAIFEDRFEKKVAPISKKNGNKRVIDEMLSNLKKQRNF